MSGDGPWREQDDAEGLPPLSPLLPALDDVGSRLASLGAELRALAGDPEPDLVEIAEAVAAVASLSAGLAQDVGVMLVRVEVHLHADKEARARARMTRRCRCVIGESPSPPPEG